MTDTRAALAQLIDDHRPRITEITDTECDCGYGGPGWALHVAAVIEESLAAPEEPPRRFVVLTITSEQCEYRERHLVIDLARADGGAALAAECETRFGAEVVAAALELHPAEPVPTSDEPF